MSSPFAVDLAAQMTQTATFQGLVAEGIANNKTLISIADTAMVANSGQMSVAFQAWVAEVSATAMNNNVKFEAIADALGFGIKSTSSTEADNASMWR